MVIYKIGRKLEQFRRNSEEIQLEYEHQALKYGQKGRQNGTIERANWMKNLVEDVKKRATDTFSKQKMHLEKAPVTKIDSGQLAMLIRPANDKAKSKANYA